MTPPGRPRPGGVVVPAPASAPTSAQAVAIGPIVRELLPRVMVALDAAATPVEVVEIPLPDVA